ncbi:myoneurin-like [Macrobrachium nipponense]|uniref:myoneurin-like n=1 Tax=Macrobrachium nipponense TaxID=159736 RepID=UPI0030C8B503
MAYNLNTPSRIGKSPPYHEAKNHSSAATTPESTTPREPEGENHVPSRNASYPRSICSSCSSAFGSASSFQDHVMQVSSIAYPCYMCRLGYYRFPIDTYFRDVTNLASDLSVCRMGQWYVCSVCKARFQEEAEAIVHIRLHCPFCKKIVGRCNYDFALESNARSHTLVRTRRET